MRPIVFVVLSLAVWTQTFVNSVLNSSNLNQTASVLYQSNQDSNFLGFFGFLASIPTAVETVLQGVKTAYNIGEKVVKVAEEILTPLVETVETVAPVIEDAVVSEFPTRPDFQEAMANFSKRMDAKFAEIQAFTQEILKREKVDERVTTRWTKYVEDVRDPLINIYRPRVFKFLQNKTQDERHRNAKGLQEHCKITNPIYKIEASSRTIISCTAMTPDELLIESEIMQTVWAFDAKTVNQKETDFDLLINVVNTFRSLMDLSRVRELTLKIVETAKSQDLTFATRRDAHQFIRKQLDSLITVENIEVCFLKDLLTVYDYNYKEIADVVNILIEDAIEISINNYLCAIVQDFPQSTSIDDILSQVNGTSDRQKTALFQLKSLVTSAWNDIFPKFKAKIKPILDNNALKAQQKANQIFDAIAPMNPPFYDVSTLVGHCHYYTENDTNLFVVGSPEDAYLAIGSQFNTRNWELVSQDADHLFVDEYDNQLTEFYDWYNTQEYSALETEVIPYVKEHMPKLLTYFPVICYCDGGWEGSRNDFGFRQAEGVDTLAHFYFLASGEYDQVNSTVY